MAPNTVSKSFLLSYLAENSTRDKFYIEYGDFLSNHLSHAAIALFYLGDDEKHFVDYAKHYQRKLEPKDGKTSKSQNSEEKTDRDLGELVGGRTNYYQLLEHYTNLHENSYGKSASALVKSEFPKLSDGVVCSALHPLIHMGYGLDVGCDEMVIEGLAYLHHSHVAPKYSGPKPETSKLGTGSRDMLEMLAEMQRDREFKAFVKRRGEEIRKELDCPRKVFQTDAMASLERGDELARLILNVKTPEFKDGEEAASWVLDQAVVAYQASTKTNDFFLLHGVTSAWALTRVTRCLDVPDVTAALFYFLNALLAAYAAQGCPEMDVKRLEDDEESRKMTWPEILHKALEVPIETTDEHVFKLVQVCRDHGGRSKHPKMDVICKRAAMTSMSKQFFS